MMPLRGISNSQEEQGMSATVRSTQFFLCEDALLHTILIYVITYLLLSTIINVIVCMSCQIVVQYLLSTS
jgi:hypothetical protein